MPVLAFYSIAEAGRVAKKHAQEEVLLLKKNNGEAKTISVE